jgi:hypothetical protein
LISIVHSPKVKIFWHDSQQPRYDLTSNRRPDDNYTIPDRNEQQSKHLTMRLLRQVEPFGPYIDVSAMFWTKQPLVTPEGHYCIIMAVAGAIRLVRQSRSSSLSKNSLLLCNIDRPSFPRLIDATHSDRKYREAFFFMQLGFTLIVV